MPPIAVTVLTAAGCPHCAAAVALAVQCARERIAAGVAVTVTVVDLSAAPALVARFAVRSVPAIVIADHVVLVGREAATRMAEVLRAVGTPRFAAEKLRTLLEARRLDEVVDELRRGDAGEGAALVALLAEGDLGMRVAVLLAFELAHERTPGCLAGLVPALLALLRSAAPRLRGDVADLLGGLGDERARGPLEALLADPDAEVAEAAAEGLARLGSPGSGGAAAGELTGRIV